jgi:hypothetical protein
MLPCESPGFGMQACPGTLFQPTATIPSPGCSTQVLGFAGQERERAEILLERTLATLSASIVLTTATGRALDLLPANAYPASLTDSLEKVPHRRLRDTLLPTHLRGQGTPTPHLGLSNKNA